MTLRLTSQTVAPSASTTTASPTTNGVAGSLQVELAEFIVIAVVVVCCSAIAWIIKRIFASEDPVNRRRAIMMLNIADHMGFRSMALNRDHINRIGEFKFDENTKLPLEGEDPSECPICLAEFRKGEVCRTMPEPCQHTFHKTCIDEWFQQSSRCPLCKRSIFSILEETQGPNPATNNNHHVTGELITRL